jgi:gliding motility-associated-like protein
MLSTPVQPTITSVSPTCSSDGTSTISNYNAGLTYTFTPAGPTVGAGGLISGMTVGTSYTVIADNGSCSSVASLPFIKVQSTPAPTLTITNNTPSICSGSSTDILLTSNVPGTIFSWNAVGTNVSGSLSGTGISINQILTTTSNLVGEVVYTVIATANGCSAAPQEVRVTINPIPNVVVSPTSQTICSGTSTNISLSGSITGTVFNWTVTQSGVTGATSGTGTSIMHVLNTSVLTTPGTATYTITPVLNGCSGTPVDVIVTVNPTPEILGTPTHLPICSGEFTNINVSAMDPATVFDYTVSAVGVTGATGGTITAGTPIAQQLETISNSQGYVDYTITPTLNGCSGTPIIIRVYVNPLPLPVLEDGAICVELSTGNVFQTYYFHTGLSNATHTFVWYYEGVIIPGATSTSYEATAAGSYSVIATNIATGCSSLEVFGTVIETNPATSFTTTVTNAFTDNATIVVNVPDGNGTIMYQIDDEALQSSNIFTGVSPGLHTITVVDTQGCTYLTQEVMVIDYPKYFTPNGDGYNDYWNIIGLQNQPGAKLYIFDRYGKLIKQISTAGQGWDGTLNTKQLPSTDYWFTIEFEEAGQQKVFRAHFSLIR